MHKKSPQYYMHIFWLSETFNDDERIKNVTLQNFHDRRFLILKDMFYILQIVIKKIMYHSVLLNVIIVVVFTNVNIIVFNYRLVNEYQKL